MSLATTCPQCQTSFKVVPDQLKLRRGLVRCGVCRGVFSGIDHLQYVDLKRRAPGPVSLGASGDFVIAHESEESDTTAMIDEVGTIEDDGAFEEFAVADSRGVLDSPDAPDSDAVPDSPDVPGSDAVPDSPDAPDSDVVLDSPAPLGERDAIDGHESVDEQAPAAAPHTADLRDNHDGDIDFETHEPGELRGEPRETNTSAVTSGLETDEPSPRMTAVRAAAAARWALRVFIVALTLGLAVQLAIGARHWLASRLPALQGQIEYASTALGLPLEIPRDMAALSITAFELQESGEQSVYAVTGLLHNHAEHPARWPAIELTLTDSEGEVLVRKVLQPADYLPPDSGQVLAVGIAGGTEHPVRIALGTTTATPAGYQARLFYP